MEGLKECIICLSIMAFLAICEKLYKRRRNYLISLSRYCYRGFCSYKDIKKYFKENPQEFKRCKEEHKQKILWRQEEARREHYHRNIKEVVEHLQKLKVWVYPIRHFDCTDIDRRFCWKDWRNKSELEYIEESKNYDWQDRWNTIGLVLGKKGLIAIKFKEPRFFPNYNIQEILKRLGLPLDYKWVFFNNEHIYIVVDAINLSSNIISKNIIKYDIITEKGLLLYINKELLPQERPRQIMWGNVQSVLTSVDKKNFKCEFKFWKYAFKSIGSTFKSIRKNTTIDEDIGCFLAPVGVLILSLLKNWFLDIVELPKWIEFILRCPIMGEVIIFVCIGIIISSVAFLYKRIKK